MKMKSILFLVTMGTIFLLSSMNVQAQTPRKKTPVTKNVIENEQPKIGGPYIRPPKWKIKIIFGKATVKGNSFDVELFESDVNKAYDEYVEDERSNKSRERIKSRKVFEEEIRKDIQDTVLRVISKDIINNGDPDAAARFGITITIHFRRFDLVINLDFNP
jgi:hypothetical protein